MENAFYLSDGRQVEYHMVNVSSTGHSIRRSKDAWIGLFCLSALSLVVSRLRSLSRAAAPDLMK